MLNRKEFIAIYLFKINAIRSKCNKRIIIMKELIKNAVLNYSIDHKIFSKSHIQMLKFNVEFNVN